jgi:hypothetical protein
MVVPVLLRYGSRSCGLRQVPARVLQADLGERVSEMEFDDATFERSMASLDNPDHVDIVIHNYRRARLGGRGEPVQRTREASGRGSDDLRLHDYAGRRRQRRASSGCRRLREEVHRPAHAPGHLGRSGPQSAAGSSSRLRRSRHRGGSDVMTTYHEVPGTRIDRIAGRSVSGSPGASGAGGITWWQADRWDHRTRWEPRAQIQYQGPIDRRFRRRADLRGLPSGKAASTSCSRIFRPARGSSRSPTGHGTRCSPSPEPRGRRYAIRW